MDNNNYIKIKNKIKTNQENNGMIISIIIFYYSNMSSKHMYVYFKTNKDLYNE